MKRLKMIFLCLLAGMMVMSCKKEKEPEVPNKPGGETSLSWAVPTNLRTRKPVLVRVSTANAVEVVKVLL